MMFILMLILNIFMVGTIKDNDDHTDVNIETIKDQDHTDVDIDQVAAGDLGENPEDCLVFEDAPLGVAAGRSCSTSLSS